MMGIRVHPAYKAFLHSIDLTKLRCNGQGFCCQALRALLADADRLTGELLDAKPEARTARSVLWKAGRIGSAIVV